VGQDSQVGLGADQLELQASARAVLAAECPPSVTREAYADPDRWRPLWKTLVDLGWHALALGDEDAGLGTLELVLVLEECGAVTAPAPVLSSLGHAAGALRPVAAELGSVVAELAEGAVGVLLATPSASRLPGPVLTWSQGRLTGAVDAVAEAARADLLVALAADDAGVPHLAVLRPGDGVEVVPAESLDPAQPLAHVRVDAAPEHCLPVDARHALAVPLVASAADLVGVAARALSVSVEHARTRHQFGQPIGAFQGVKHRLADGYVAVERARSLTYAAAVACRRPGPPDPATWRLALLAKAAAGEAAADCTRTGVAVHGAIGQTWEHDLHLLVRRAWHGGAVLGESRALYTAAGRSYVEEAGA
jgi:alkylation response protein AidB-like acyl-CoA dehydrogenase